MTGPRSPRAAAVNLRSPIGVVFPPLARVLMADGRPAGNLFAAGEIMAGNILGRGYLAGFGMTIGTVFGRLAGAGAARHARN